MSKPKPSKPVLLAVSLKQFYYLKGIAEFTFKQLLMLKGTVRFTLSHSVILKRIALVVSLSLVFGLSYLVTWSPSLAHAATTSTVNFQARLENASGAIVPDGTYNVEFKIYNTLSTGGTAQGVCTGNCLWYEDYLVGGTPVTVSNGYMTVNLGSQTAFPSTIPWGSPLYLAMNIGGTGGSPTWDGEMSPRLTLTAVPTAFSLESAAGSFTSTLTFVQPTANESILLPAESGSTETVCYQSDSNCGFINNQNASPQTTANFDISGEGQVATLDAEGSTLAIGGAATYTGAINIDTSASVTTGTVSIGGTAQTGAITVGAATTSTQTINIENATATGGTQTVSIDSGNDTASTQTVNIATGTSTTSGAKNVNIATGAPGTGTSTTVDIGNGGGANGTVSVLIGSNGAAAHTTTIQGGNGAGAISLQAASGGVISIGTNATNAVNIGLSGTPTYVSEGDNEGTNLTSLSIVSHANGNLIALAFKLNLNDRVSTVSGGGVSHWHLVTYNDSGINGEEIWEGTVTSFGTNTVNATYIAASGSTELAYEEFSSTYAGNTNWFVTTSGDKVNTPASINITYPSLTASETGGLYFGYGVTATTGSSSSGGGFTYTATSIGKNVLAYDTTISSGTIYSPVGVTTSALSDAVGMIAIPYSSASTVNVIGSTGLNGNITSAVTIEPAQNMETAFQIQNNTGVNAFNVDTQDNLITSGDTFQVGPGVTTATPKYLYLADVTATSNGNPQIIGQWDSTNNWGIGPNDDVSTSGGDSELRIGTTSANGVNTWTSTNQNLNLVVAGTENIQTLTNSTTALQVQNASGNYVIDASTSNSNLVSNSSFDANATNWAAKGTVTGGVTQDTTAGTPYTGIGALKAVAAAVSSGMQSSTFASAITATTQYQLTFYAKCSSSITTFTYGRQDVSGTDVNSTTAGNCNTNWQQYTAHWTTGGTITSPNIYMDSGTTASVTIWVDAVSLVQTTTSAATNYQPGTLYLPGVIASPAIFENGANSTTAFQVQNATGSDTLDVDTTDGYVNLTGDVNSTSSETTGTAQSYTDNSVTTGAGLGLSANALTTGYGANLTTTSNTQTAGSLFNLSDTATLATSGGSVSGSLLNVNRNLTANVSGSSTLTPTVDHGATFDTYPASTSQTDSFTVNSGFSNYYMVIGVFDDLGNPAPTVSYAGVSATLLKSGGIGSGSTGVYLYGLIAPATGANNLVVSGGSNSGEWAVAVEDLYNVNQTTPEANATSAKGTTAMTSQTVTTVSGDVAADFLAETTPPITVGGSQTAVNTSPNYTMTFGPGTVDQSTEAAVGTSTSMIWNSPTWWGWEAIDLKGSTATNTETVSSAVASISNNCIQTSGTCGDTTNVLSLNQQFASAGGAVLNVKNSGTGYDLQLQNGSNSTLFAVGATGDVISNSSETTGTAQAIVDNGITTGSGFNLSANALTTGSGANLSTTANTQTAGSLLNLADTATLGSNGGSYSGQLLNVSRTLTANVGTVGEAISHAGGPTNTSSTSASQTRTESVTTSNSGDLVFMTVLVNSATITVSSITNGSNTGTWTRLNTAVDATHTDDLEIWYASATAASTQTATVHLSATPPSIYVETTADSFHGAGAPTWNIIKSAHIYYAGDVSNGVVYPALSTTAANQEYWGESDPQDVYVSNTNALTGFTSVIGGSTGLTGTTYNTSSLTSGNVYTPTGAQNTANAYSNNWGVIFEADISGGGSANVLGAVANISSNCTSSTGSCNDTSNVLKVSQQYSSATGAALLVQNSGSGYGLQVENGSSSTLLAVGSTGDVTSTSSDTTGTALGVTGTGITTGNVANFTTPLTGGNANNLTSGNVVNITSASAAQSSTGALLNVSDTATLTTNGGSDTGNTVNISRALTADVTTGSTTPAFDASSYLGGSGVTSGSTSFTVGTHNNRYLLVSIGISEGACSGAPYVPTSVTYGSATMSLLDTDNLNSGVQCTYIYGLADPAEGSNTLTYNFTISTTYGSTITSWYNVSQSSPTGAFTEGGTAFSNTTTTPSVTATSTSGQEIVDMVNDDQGGNTCTTAAPTRSQALWQCPDYSSGAWSSGSSYFTATGSTTTMSWSNAPTPLWYWTDDAIALNGASLSEAVSSPVASLSNQCTTTAGTCTDATNVLQLTQNYSSATGAVLAIQNSGTGDMLDLDNGSSVILDSFSGNGTLTIGKSGGSSSPALLILGIGTSSSDPTEVNGAMYYNSSTGQFRCGVGGSWENCMNGPAYTLTTTAATTAALVLTANHIYFAPMYVPGPITVNDLYIDISVNSGSGDVGIYNSSGNLVMDGGSGSVSGSGLKTISPTAASGYSLTLTPGQYYAAFTNSAGEDAAGVTLSVTGLYPGVGNITSGGGAALPSSISLTSTTGTLLLDISIAASSL